MKVELVDISKKFQSDWIFRSLTYTFNSGSTYAILGPNGSGKSTLLQVIAGNVSPTTGTRSYHFSSGEINEEKLYRYLGFAAPYLELIEEFTLEEQLRFHRSFKPFLQNLSEEEILDIMKLERHKNKTIRFFSSGMKQRLKLVLAILSDVPLILLDEPLTNLDKEGEAWYHQLIKDFRGLRTVIVCSNRPSEYSFCEHELNIMKYK